MASSSKTNPSRPANSGKPSAAGARSPESFQSLDRRNRAAEILQSYEKLSWYSMQRCESLTQTRLHFQNIVAGFTDADEAALVDWREDLTPHPPKPGVEATVRRKGNERAGLGVGETMARAGPSGTGGGSGSAKKKRRSSDGRIVT